MKKRIHSIKNWYLILTILMFVVFIIIYLVNIYNLTTISKKLPPKNYSKKDVAVRGSIISKDNFILTKSVQIYKVIIDTRFIDKDKINLFVDLFSIYSNIDKELIYKKLNKQKKLGRLVLSYNIDSRTAANLNHLSSRLLKLKVFRPIVKKSSFVIGMDIVISGDKKVYPYIKTLTPLLGHVKKFEQKKITRIKGINGLEKYYNKELSSYRNGLLKGQRDLIGDIIFNESSKMYQRKDGNNIKLNIPIKLQNRIEYITDEYKSKFDAKEILISVMDSRTGEILSLATSNRYNPKNIKQNEIGYLNINAIELAFEPGSIIKPITMALVFDKNRVKKDELIFAYNNKRKNRHGLYRRGKYKIKRHIIGDDHQFEKRDITPSDIIVYSSNIGILQLAQRLKAQEFIDGFKSFSLSEKTGVDLPYEKKGSIHSLIQYQAYEDENKDNIYKATDSYGHGITSTFMQVLKAYSVFNNHGKIVTPKIASTISNRKLASIQIIKPQTALIIKKMLIKTVKLGTGKNTDIKGLEIGGKTGTAQIARKGKYQKEYISSFFGFANDKVSKYTIGVTVFEPSYKYHYASQSATVVFKDVIKVLLEQRYLQL